MKKLYIIIYLFLLFSLKVHSQSASNNVGVKLFFEKAYLHTDREIYIGGETLWFSAFLVNAQNNSFTNSSNTLYVELISTSKNNNAEVVDKKIIRIEQGKGAGDFKLQDSISSGSYTLRAWTNWMRNFGDQFIFEKEIKILNSFEIKAGDGNTKKKNAIKTTPSNHTETKQSFKENIQFFPEGGSMLENAPSIVAFKAVNANGNNLGVEGVITNKSGETIAKLSSQNGKGIFFIQPEVTQIYTASGVYSNGQKFSATLPKVLSNGYSIRVVEKDSLINVYINQTNEGEKEVLLTGKTRGKTYFSTQFLAKDLLSLVQIPKKDFPEGIMAITLYDNKGRPNCERLVYIDKKETPKITITTDKAIYNLKEKVTLNIKSVDSKNNPIPAVISLAALDAKLIPANQINIMSYLLLESELKGKIENPTQYFDKNNPDRFKQLNLLLLTQGWRDFLWRRLADEQIKISNVAEKGITVKGNVNQTFSGKPISNSNITLFANNAKGNKLFSGKTDSTGVYHIYGLEIYGYQVIKISSADDKGKKNGYLQVDSLYKGTSLLNKTKNQLDTVLFDQKIAKEMTFRNQKKVSITDTIQLSEVKINGDKNTRLFGDVAGGFGYPDESFTVTSKDFDFTNLGHYLLYKSKQAVEKTDVEDPGKSRIVFPFFGKNLQPLIIVNGKELPFTADDPQEVKDNYYSTYYSIPMNKVEKVVIKHLVGGNKLSLGAESEMSEISKERDVFIIYLTLKPGAIDRKNVHTINEQVDGYYETRLFYNPVSGNTSNPNQNTTIYWKPNIFTNENGEAQVSFYNTDTKSMVNITAEGLTFNGIPVVSKAVFEVK